jgi:mono/diheme cytochrome c family protein
VHRAPRWRRDAELRDAVADVIENGTSRMPAFKSSLTDDQVKTLIAHVRALAR